MRTQPMNEPELHPYHAKERNEMLAYIGRLERECDALRLQRTSDRAVVDRVIDVLSRIHNVIYPQLFKMQDGVVMQFRPPNPHEYLQALADKIRAIPDELEAVKAQQEQSDAAQ